MNSTARAALFFTFLTCASAAGQFSQSPNPVLVGIEVLGIFDYDGDGVDELVGTSAAVPALWAATLDANGELLIEQRVVDDVSRSENFQLADVDGDGQLDLAGIRRREGFGDQIVVFYDRGNPTFEEATVIVSITEGRRLSVTDFDSDGDADCVIYPASEDLRQPEPTGRIVLYRGLGNGQFGGPESVQTSPNLLVGAVPVDLDQDGDEDFVAVLDETAELAIARNAGGALTLTPLAGSHAGYLDIAVGDVNADALPDVVALRRSTFGGPATVDLYLQNGTGGFSAPQPILVDAPSLEADVNLGDFNGDLMVDVAITKTGTVQTAHQVQVLIGDGLGGFSMNPASSTGAGEAQIRCAVGDVNGDGRDDLFSLSQSQFASRPIGLIRLGLPSDGIGDLAPPIEVTFGQFSSSGLTGDLDGDGVLDLIGRGAASLAWLRGTADSIGFEEPRALPADGTPLLVADFDGDGVDEILVELQGQGGLGLIDGLGGGAFAPLVTPTLTLPANVITLLADDFDGDGDVDIVASNVPGFAVSWMANLSGFAFDAPAAVNLTPASSAIGPLVLGDFNGDGSTDIATRRLDFLTPVLAWAEGLGGGAVAPLQDLGNAGPDLLTFDLEGDGFDDLLTADTMVRWIPGGPSGLQPGTGQTLVSTVLFQRPLGSVDFDGDGLVDLITESVGEIFAFRRLPVSPIAFEQAPALVAEKPTYITGQATLMEPRVVDLGGDSDLDLLLGFVETLLWYENLESGPVGAPYCGPAVSNSTGLPSRILSVGSDDVNDNSLTLRAFDLPANAFGFFIVSLDSQPATVVTGSSGQLCLDGEIGRYVGAGQIGQSGAGGAFSLGLDLTAIPQPLGFVAAQSGSTWYFQAWHRDSSPSGPTSNFTDGLRVTFQ